MSVEFSIDQTSLDNLKRQIEEFKKRTGHSAYTGLCAAALQLRNDAMLRLRERKHIITSRLRNSIYIKVSKQDKSVSLPDNGLSYSDDTGATYNRDLKTVTLDAGSIAVGTNVEYAGAIEFGHGPIAINSPVNMKKIGWRYLKTIPAKGGDSFLYWAFKNINVNQSVAEKMKEDLSKYAK
jgi:hypothetical protein